MQVDIIKELQTQSAPTLTAAKPKSGSFDSTLRDCEAKTDGKAKEQKDNSEDNTTVAILSALYTVPVMPLNAAVEKNQAPITSLGNVTDVSEIVTAEENGTLMQNSSQGSANPQPLTTMDPGFSHLIETSVIPQKNQATVPDESQVIEKTAFTLNDVDMPTVNEQNPDLNLNPIDAKSVTNSDVKPQQTTQLSANQTVNNRDIPLEQAGLSVDAAVLNEAEPQIVTTAKPQASIKTPKEQTVNDVSEAVNAVSTDTAKKAPMTEAKSDEKGDSFSDQKDDSNGFETAAAAAANTVPVDKAENTEKFPSALKTDTANQISDAVRQAADTGRTEVKIHLNPEELGPISIKIVSQNGVFSVQISADNRSTSQLIASSMHELTQSMQDRGITMDKAEVNYAGSTLDTSAQNQQQSSQYQGNQQSNDYNMPKWTVAMETGGKTTHDAAAVKAEEPDLKPVGDDSSISMLV